MKAHPCHPFQLVFSVVSLLLLLTLTGVYLDIQNYAAAVIFAVLLGLYGYFNWNTLCFVKIDDQGITRSLLGVKQYALSWGEISEAGVLFPNVAKRLGPNKRPSQCSIYVSKQKMDSETRLEACVNWPPKEVIELGYTPERLRELCARWDRKLILFNVTSWELFGKESTVFDLDADEIRY